MFDSLRWHTRVHVLLEDARMFHELELRDPLASSFVHQSFESCNDEIEFVLVFTSEIERVSSFLGVVIQ